MSKLKTVLGNKFFSNTSWMLFEKAYRMILVLIVNVLLARYLGPHDYGLLNYVISVVSIFAIVASGGLDELLVREYVNNEEKEAQLTGSGLLIKGSLALALTVPVISYGWVFSESHTEFLLFAIISLIMFFQSGKVFESYFQAKVEAKYSSIAQALQMTTVSFVRIGLIIGKFSLIWFALAVALEWFLFLTFNLIFFHKKNQSSFKNLYQIKIDTVKKLISEAWPLIFSGLLVSIYLKIDQVMLRHMLDESQVGIYVAATRLSESWYFFPMVITSSLFPSIIIAKTKSANDYMSHLLRLYSSLFWLSVIVGTFIFFTSDYIISFLYGAEYLQSAFILTIHIWNGALVSFGLVSSKWLLNEGLIKHTMYRTLAGAVVNIGLNFILIPISGVTGAALATLASQLVAAYLYDLSNQKLRESFKLKTISVFYLPKQLIAGKF